MKAQIILMPLLLLTVPAQGALVCPTFSALKMRMDRCEDNFVIAGKADACLSQYIFSVQAGKSAAQKLLTAVVSKSKSEQGDLYKTSGQTLDLGAAEIEKLILQGVQAKLAVESLLDNIFFPEDYDNPELIGMSTTEYLAKEPCYATPRKVMTEDGELLGLMVEDLRKTKAELLAGKNLVQGQGADMSSLNSGSAAGAAKPATPQMKVKAPKDSDVSGREEDRKARQQKPQ